MCADRHGRNQWKEADFCSEHRWKITIAQNWELLQSSFPIPEDQYEESIRALKKIKIGTTLDKDCCVADLRSTDCPALRRMINRMANVDELDWLGKQLESFDRYELLQFNTAAERFGLSSVGEMIDLSLQSGEVTVISDFSDLALIGKRHYLTVHGGADPKELDNLDGTETARQLVSEQQGHITTYGVVYDNGMKLEQVYDGRFFPCYYYEPNAITVAVTSKSELEDTEHITWLYLPMEREEIDRALLRGGITDPSEIRLSLEDSWLPHEVFDLLDMDHVDISELNALVQALDEFSDMSIRKYAAAAVMARPHTTEQAKHLAENLDLFDFAPSASTPEEYGKYMIRQSGCFDYDENLDAFYNYEKYGTERMNEEDGMFTDRGYIAYKGYTSMEEVMNGSQSSHMVLGGLSR